MQSADWARFLSKTELDAPCVIWMGSKTKSGYGRMSVNDEIQYAHRLAYEHFSGVQTPDGMYVRHLCENPACVRFVHLAVGTPSQNRWDMTDEARRQIAVDAWAKRSPVKRAIHAAKMRAARTPEGIRRGALKMTVSRIAQRAKEIEHE